MPASRLRSAEREIIRQYFRARYGGPEGWRDVLVVDDDAALSPLERLAREIEIIEWRMAAKRASGGSVAGYD